MGGGAEDDGGQPPWMLMALAVDASLAVVLFFFFLFHLKMVLDNHRQILWVPRKESIGSCVAVAGSTRLNRCEQRPDFLVFPIRR